DYYCQSYDSRLSSHVF
nr:immunoglobulin light chain junction region [Macaca mulatta]MOW66701.1 immunoglobulin light chain junction region [Macaca mulatta]MOW68199.1 immunoglobulin light chain junction region [Macaca mulatta]MOW68508.1 immunoglobulin light chain junction region [Macaca mulatta]MOW70541.1 immunoglobulin light chain junction region [Macaca mulatta]